MNYQSVSEELIDNRKLDKKEFGINTRVLNE